MARHSFIQMTKLHDVAGRIDYISSEQRQEFLYGVYRTCEDPFWKKLAKENQRDFLQSGSKGICIEARELVIALPEDYLNYNRSRILKKFTDFFKERYGVECIAALHHNKNQTNYHIHLIFSERKELTEPEVKIATRNMFYDETGKRCRTKKEILDEYGELRKGCYIIPKGEPYSGHYFKHKEPYFKQKAFLREVKEVYTELINEEVLDEKAKLKVYNKDSIYLATKKIGKNNPMEDIIRRNNEAINKWNFYASHAAIDMSAEHVKEVKRQMITEPVKASIAEGNSPEMYRQIVKLATRTLNRLVQEWYRLPREDCPEAKSDMFSRMIAYCMEKVLKKRERGKARQLAMLCHTI